ncbi:hypothetical protein MLD38_015252 [Melastoma candidum]|uniref:Uncharacterized protein n=1 Tax=Melastoma candidum TaxID=119954 RepID=A0ACB9RIL0_9MYRT|nr:hypothetical protein MLD38_015252 [Melastoma candidum]
MQPRKHTRKKREKNAGRQTNGSSARRELQKLRDIVPGCNKSNATSEALFDKVTDYVLLLELKASLLRRIARMYGV